MHTHAHAPSPVTHTQKNTKNCKVAPPGSTFDSGTNITSSCLINTFKAGYNRRACVACGTGLKTVGTGATSFSSCYVPAGYGTSVDSGATTRVRADACVGGAYGVPVDTYGVKNLPCRYCPDGMTTYDVLNTAAYLATKPAGLTVPNPVVNTDPSSCCELIALEFFFVACCPQPHCGASPHGAPPISHVPAPATPHPPNTTKKHNRHAARLWLRCRDDGRHAMRARLVQPWLGQDAVRELRPRLHHRRARLDGLGELHRRGGLLPDRRRRDPPPLPQGHLLCRRPSVVHRLPPRPHDGRRREGRVGV